MALVGETLASSPSLNVYPSFVYWDLSIGSLCMYGPNQFCLTSKELDLLHCQRNVIKSLYTAGTYINYIGFECTAKKSYWHKLKWLNQNIHLDLSNYAKTNCLPTGGKKTFETSTFWQNWQKMSTSQNDSNQYEYLELNFNLSRCSSFAVLDCSVA